MLLELPLPDLQKLVARQLDHFFGIGKDETAILNKGIEDALIRAAYSFSFYRNKYYRKEGKTYFNPFHSGQYAIFLYFLSNSVFQNHPGRSLLADKIYYLNKALNSVDLFYEIQMPRIFFADHPLSSVMGRATYGDRFSFAQNCTVGNNHGLYPEIGENVKMSVGATILGKSHIGDNVIIAAGAYVKDMDIPPNSIVFGAYPNLVIKQRDEAYFRDAGVDYPDENQTAGHLPVQR
jgi:serine O-acetyltransferase